MENLCSQNAPMSASSENKRDELLAQMEEALQCPFTWPIPRGVPERTITKVEWQAAEDTKQGKRFGPGLTLTLCFEYAERGELEKAFNIWQEWAKNVETPLKLEDVRGGSVGDLEFAEEMVSTEGYKHVMFACKCFLLLRAKRFTEAEEMLKIISSKNMSSNDQAIIFYLQSDVLKNYGTCGLEEAIPKVEHGLELSPQLVHLHYQLGRLLGRLRRTKRSNFPDLKEIQSLEAAVRETETPAIMVMLAQSYREFGNLMGNMEQEKREMYQKASDLYSKILQLPKGDSKRLVVNVRCAEGLMKLPPPWRDLDKAKTCLDEVLAAGSSNDSQLNHVTATYYTKTNNFEEAKRYLILATSDFIQNYGACIDLIKMREKESRQYNPIPDLEKMLANIKDQHHVEDVLCMLGCCYYYRRNHFRRALEYWSQVIEQNIDSKKLMVFLSPIRGPYKININELIVTEIHRLITQRRDMEHERVIYEKLIKLFPHLQPRNYGEGNLNQAHPARPLRNVKEMSWRRGNDQFESEAGARTEDDWRLRDRSQGQSTSSAFGNWRSHNTN